MLISKHYRPEEVESKWYQAWLKAKAFASEVDEREPYTVLIPPPNITGVLHMGHILNNTLQDVLVRRARMLGKNALWLPGMDHASIATEAKVVKMLREKGIKKSDIGRERFMKYAFEWKDKYGGIILEQLQKLGCSCDWDRTRFTMEEDLYQSVVQTFVKMHQDGYVYRGKRMVNWDPKGLTALSDEEVIYHEEQSNLYHIRYQIKETKEFLTIATTRPETLFGDSGIAVHPEDSRYQHLIGKTAIVPIVEREIPIISDEYVQMDFGTGALKVTPAHDSNDYELGIKHDLEIIDIFNPNGTLNDL
ncbi:MAG: class I tRNA ligase family protein, partial [Bacteroidota bacterium]|nr:class I tRNA ligase family protein [Bacteroidota bacterium]